MSALMGGGPGDSQEDPTLRATFAPGQALTSAYLDRGNRDAIQYEFFPLQASGAQASIQLEDSADPVTGYKPVLDSNGLQTAVTGPIKFLISGTYRFVKPNVTVVSGTWMVIMAGVFSGNKLTTTQTLAGTVAQGAPNAGGANAWPVAVGNFPATTDVSDRAVRAVGVVTAADGGITSIGALADLATANSVIGRLKALVASLAGGLPAALGAGGALAVDTTRSLPLASARVNVNIAGASVLVPAVAGQRVYVYAYALILAAANTITLQDTAAVALEGPMTPAANGGVSPAVDPPGFLFATATSAGLSINLANAVQVGGRISYWQGV